ncbi:RHS repeat protein [Frateuria sp. MAH-13]|uniref:RHS repeat protein n=1 Tax=Frateuria flava TaxID=2821489 RepID=A0ABS4DK35_9GAMM|nr:RHS repeat protein [Frateuria flava]MBP1473405.1 RHS repeat protein [Frateuria flava]
MDMPGQGWARACLCAAFLLVVNAPATATDARPEDEYKKLVRVDENIQPLGEHPFGENIGLYDGSLSFTQTDVSLGGNGLPLALTRQFQVEHDRYVRSQFAFGDWDLVLPHLETMTVSGFDPVLRRISGWEVETAPGIDPNLRCTYFNTPPTVTMQPGDSALTSWEPRDWWKGYHLVLPGQGSQDMLANHDPASRSVYPAVTKNQWRFSCLGSTSNGAPGEGFLAQAPDGTRYWFDELVYRGAQGLVRPLYESGIASRAGGGRMDALWASRGDILENVIALLSGSSVAHAAPSTNSIQRQVAQMLVTRIQDRFGNWLVFQYDSGLLTGITASDGRALSVEYVQGTPRIQKLVLRTSTDGVRTWTYAYTSDVLAPALSSVTLPDGSQWTYDLGSFDAASLSPGNNHSSCVQLGTPTSLASVVGTVTHPSGLQGIFTLKPVKRGRSLVPRDCKGMERFDEDAQGSYASIPDAWYGLSIQDRTLSGAGIPPGRTWQYRYSAPNESWSDCTGTCATTVYTDVENPDGSTVRYLFSNKFDHTESLLLKTTYYTGAAGSAALRTESNSYADPDTAPLPAEAGAVLQENVNTQQITRYFPLQRRQIVQDGADTYTWEVVAFNGYAQATRVKRYNSFSSQAMEEDTTYLNDTGLWVFGLPERVTNRTTGKVVDEYTYNTSNLTLASRAHFGQTVMSYAFNAQGQLASFTDGRGNSTTLDSYKRGIPQTIDYPDGTHQRLVVDDFGQIKSITDQAGATTSYGYDAIGRLARIDYPGADEQAWYPRTFSYEFVNSAERGVAANHWRRVVSKGDQRQVTYFDALLQPVLTDSYMEGRGDSHSNVRVDYNYKGLTTLQSYPASGTPDLSALGTGVHSLYDPIGRLTLTQQDSELGALSTSVAYLSGARRKVTDPRNKATITRYQVFDQPVYESPVTVDAPAGVSQEITRNIYGNPTEIRQYGSYNGFTEDERKTLVYDDQQRLCRTIEPESGSEVLAYDEAGNLAWSAAGLSLPAPTTGTEADCGRTLVPPEARTTRAYDPMNRVLSSLYPQGTPGVAFHYLATGQIDKACSGAVSWTAETCSGFSIWTYGYNALGQMKSESLDVEGHQWPITYSHDRYGSVSRITYPDGKELDYAPDAMGRPSKVGVYAADIVYFPSGNVQYYRLGDGTEYMGVENERQILGSLNYFHPSSDPHAPEAVLSQQYTYDPSGNLTIVDALDDRRDKSFGYDDLNRLTFAQATGLWGTETYAYDPLNNLRQLSSDGLNRSYVYDGYRHLAQITANGSTLHTFHYDAQGNVTQKDGTSLVFDKANRLTQVVGGSAYAYDAHGRRIKKTSPTGDVYYLYTTDGRLLYQFDAAANVETDYVYLGRKLLAEVHRNVGDLVLNPPANIYFSNAPNDGSYTVGWFQVPTARYELQESPDSGASWHEVYSGTVNSKSFSGQAAGSYLYRVRACTQECSDWRESPAMGVWPQLATVTVPTGLQSASFTVSWTRPSTATRFDVDQQQDGGNWVRIATDTPGLSISRSGLAVGSYVYRVAAKSSYGSRGWAASEPVTVLYAPTAMPSLSVPSVSSQASYTVSWSAVANADRYELEEQQDAGAWGARYNGASRSTVVSGVTNGAHYGYRVRGCNAVGCGPYSAVATVAIAIPPPAPTAVYANDLRVNPKLETLTVVWQASAGATYYEVKDADTGSVVGSTTGTSKEVESVYDGPLSMHSYAVRACNPYACSGWVSAVQRDVYNPPSTAPSLSAPSTNGTGSYTVSWGTVFQASSYTLQESVNGGAWSTVYSGGGTSRSFSGKAVASYRYRVMASNSGGNGPWSATVTVTVAIVTNVTGVTAQVRWVSTGFSAIASAPSLKAAPAGSTDVSPSMMPPPPEPTYAWFLTASWNGATGATRYEVRATDTVTGAVKTFNVTTLSIPATEVSHSGQSVTARACDANGCSAWSSPVTAVKL